MQPAQEAPKTVEQCYRELCEVLTAARQIDIARFQAETRIRYLKARIAELNAQAAPAPAAAPVKPKKPKETAP